MTEVPITEEQWVHLFFFTARDLIEWFQSEQIEVPEIRGLTLQRKAVFADPVSAAAFKLRWL